MPGKQSHIWGGVGTAVAVDLLAPPRVDQSDRLWHGVGAALGGAFGGVLPDVLEPASDPNHRQFCHGILPSLACWYFSKGFYEQGYQAVLKWASSADPGFWLPEMHDGGRGLPRWLRMVIAGFVRAVPIGYLSHLALDLLTPRSLPLVGSLDALVRPATVPARGTSRRRSRCIGRVCPR